MARLAVDGSDLVLGLSGLEKVEGFHGDNRVPTSTVREVRLVEDPWSELRGMRAPGTGVPGVIAVGTRRARGVKDFAAVHGRGPGVVVELEGAAYDRFVVTDDDAQGTVETLRHQLKGGNA